MALQEAQWRGRINERVRNQGEDIRDLRTRVDGHDDEIDELRQRDAARRAMDRMVAAIAGIVGSAFGVALADLLFRMH